MNSGHYIPPNGLASPSSEQAYANEDAAAQLLAALPYRPEVEFSRNRNRQECFEELGRWLAWQEQKWREVITGTKEEQLTCEVRYVPATHNLAQRVADALWAFKREAFAEAEKYKEITK